MRSYRIGIILVFIFFSRAGTAGAQTAAVQNPGRENTVRERVTPVRILWSTPDAGSSIVNAERLLKPGNGQADLNTRDLCVLKSTEGKQPSILLDFGKELHGGIQLVTGMWAGSAPIEVRLCFGESASEAMSSIEPIKGATNEHAMRDFKISLPWLGKLETGNTGFRFLRIDLISKGVVLPLKEVNALAVYRDIPYLGSFKCSDELLNEIWQTGAYTVHLNMQDYLWDGVKRDRLVWVGDMHPEVSTINAVFGSNEVVAKSLDLSRDITELPDWMNGISAYSMWWILIQRDLYQYNGDLPYLMQQKEYMTRLLDQLITKIGTDNSEKLDGNRFLDWPSSENPEAVHAGLQALMVMTLQAGQDLCTIMKDPETAEKCATAVSRLKKQVPDMNGSKQAAALLTLSGLISPEEGNKVISAGGTKNFSTFYGYYMLQAKAKAGDYEGAMAIIREYWGAMLHLGATTFWEDFNMDWLPNASRIDELVPEGKKDIHGDYGAYCYKGFRHSLAHGWASGPTPWLTEHVLGVQVLEPGCKVIQIKPHLGNLTFAEGTFPTPLGIVKIKHVKLSNGKVRTTISAPRGVTIKQ